MTVAGAANSNLPGGRFARTFETEGGQLLVTLEKDDVFHAHLLLRMRDEQGADLYFRYIIEGFEPDTIAFFERMDDEKAERMAEVVLSHGHRTIRGG